MITVELWRQKLTRSLSIDRLSLRIAFWAASASWADKGGRWTTEKFEHRSRGTDKCITPMNKHSTRELRFCQGSRLGIGSSNKGCMWNILIWYGINKSQCLIIWKVFCRSGVISYKNVCVLDITITFHGIRRFVWIRLDREPITQFRQRILPVNARAAIKQLPPVAHSHAVTCSKLKRL